MRWSWDEYENTPKAVVDELIAMLNEEHEEREREKAHRQFLKRHGASTTMS